MDLSIAVSFLILVSLLLWIVIKLKSHWILKLFFIFIAIGWSVSVHNGLDSFSGWATHEELPDKFLLRKALVNEPNKSTNSAGAIYLMIQRYGPMEERSILSKFFEYNEQPKEPRMFYVEYSKEMHKQIQGVQGDLNKSIPVLVTKNGKDKGKGKDEDGGKGKKGREGEDGEPGDGEGSLSQKQKFEFHRLPPSKLPEKVR